jgi:hypothetical protein
VAQGPLALGGAGGVGATSNPRFVQLDQGQNIDPTNRRGGPQMTALNLSGLFGGMPQGNPSATPRAGVPGANAPPRVPGPMASPTTGQPMPMSTADAAANFHNVRGMMFPNSPDFSNLPNDIFNQAGAGPMTRRRGSTPSALAAAAASLKQRYG